MRVPSSASCVVASAMNQYMSFTLVGDIGRNVRAKGSVQFTTGRPLGESCEEKKERKKEIESADRNKQNDT